MRVIGEKHYGKISWIWLVQVHLYGRHLWILVDSSFFFHISYVFSDRVVVIQLVVKSLKNPRSAVCKTAIMTCSDIFTGYGDTVVESLDPLVYPFCFHFDSLSFAGLSQGLEFHTLDSSFYPSLLLLFHHYHLSVCVIYRQFL